MADKPDSMEICFIPDGDYAAWLERRGAVPPPGDFVDRDGKVLGRHGGIHRYTLGQGRGLGVSGPHKYYVTEIDPACGKVVLSDGADLMAGRVYCADMNWLAVDGLPEPLEVTVRLRHSKTELAAVARAHGENVVLEMHTPARAPTPGSWRCSTWGTWWRPAAGSPARTGPSPAHRDRRNNGSPRWRGEPLFFYEKKRWQKNVFYGKQKRGNE